jgi:hypothetical protein
VRPLNGEAGTRDHSIEALAAAWSWAKARSADWAAAGVRMA